MVCKMYIFQFDIPSSCLHPTKDSLLIAIFRGLRSAKHEEDMKQETVEIVQKNFIYFFRNYFNVI